jgi:hypothetical protein
VVVEDCTITVVEDAEVEDMAEVVAAEAVDIAISLTTTTPTTTGIVTESADPAIDLAGRKQLRIRKQQ